MSARRRALISPAKAQLFAEERRRQLEHDAERLDPLVTAQLLQMIKLFGKKRLLRFIEGARI